MNVIEGKLDGKGVKVAIVASRFNDFINEKLIAGAKECLTQHGADEKNITLIRVPGAFEIPFMARKAAKGGKFDAVICIGTIIRGATRHYEDLSSYATKAVGDVGIATSLPVTFGIITCESIEQAIERAGSKAGNRGWDAAMSALEMIDLNKKKI